MARHRRMAVCLVLTAFLSPPVPAAAHEQHHTHNYLARASVWLLDNPLIDAHAESLIAQGTIDEDQCPNYYSHFVNARTGELMRNAVVPPPSDSNCPDDVDPRDNQTTAPVRAGNLWAQAVGLYRAGDRDAAFKTLGQALHLLQDMTSPAHVHNAPHGIPLRSNCFQDSDDFETWGWCDDNATRHILDYWDAASGLPTDRFARSLEILFQRTPQFACSGTDPQACPRNAEPNMGFAYVRRVAEIVYDFTTFPAILVDFEFSTDPQPDSELKRMFPSLRDASGGWAIDDETGQQNIGFTDGNCGKTELTWPATREEWWPMENPGGGEDGPDCFIQDDILGNNNRTSGGVFIENTGGGGANADLSVPDNLIPHVYQRSAGGREFYRDLYQTDDNLSQESGFPDPPGKPKSMLRIYGDILYPIAAVYGAGFIQAFLDEVNPRLEASATLIGKVNPHKKKVCFRVEPVDSSFSLLDVSLSSITLAFHGDLISAVPPTQLVYECLGSGDGDDDDDDGDNPQPGHHGNGNANGHGKGDGKGHGDRDGDRHGDRDRRHPAHSDSRGCEPDSCVPAFIQACFSTHDIQALFGRMCSVPDSLNGATIQGELTSGRVFVATIGGKQPDDGDDEEDGDKDQTSDWKGKLAVRIHPNPMNPKTEISFTIGQSSQVRVAVYDLAGRLVKTIHEGDLPAGANTLSWNGTTGKGTRASSGIYFVSVEAANLKEVKRVAVVK